MPDVLTVLAVPGVGLWPPLFDRTITALDLQARTIERPTTDLGFELTLGIPGIQLGAHWIDETHFHTFGLKCHGHASQSAA